MKALFAKSMAIATALAAALWTLSCSDVQMAGKGLPGVTESGGTGQGGNDLNNDAPNQGNDLDDADLKAPGKISPDDSGKGAPQPSPMPSPSIPIDDGSKNDPKGPTSCTAASIVFIPKMQASCPKNFAAFAADDADSPNFSCCPLPWGDMIDHAIAPQSRGTTCNPGEVITGLNGRQVLCSKINEAKYSVGPAVKTCYVGSGASGGQGSAKCKAPTETMQALVSRFGSDACLGVPYGSLMVSRTGDKCKNITAVEIRAKDTGLPVKMFP